MSEKSLLSNKNPSDADDIGIEAFFNERIKSNSENPEVFDDAPVSPMKMPRVYRFGTDMKSNLMSVHAALLHYNEDNGTTVFFRNGVLVYAKKDEQNRTIIKNMKRPDLYFILKMAGSWKKYGKDDEIEPDKGFLDAVLAGVSPQDLENVPALKGVRSGAYLTEDGIEVKEGFNKKTGILLTNGFDVEPVPENPSAEDIEHAKQVLKSIFGDFKFETNTDYENTILAVCSLVTQQILSEPVPILVVDKNTSGAGGTFLCTIIGIAALGHPPSLRPTTGRVGEMDKEVRSAVLEGESFTVLDNIKPGTD